MIFNRIALGVIGLLLVLEAPKALRLAVFAAFLLIGVGEWLYGRRKRRQRDS